MGSQFAKKSLLYPKIEKLDDNVIVTLPPDVEVLAIVPSGANGEVQTVRMDTREKDGTERTYFQKTIKGEEGRRMKEGSYESEKIFHHYAPSHVPEPISWGSYAADPDMYVYFCGFHDLVDEVPAPKTLVPIIAQVHKASTGKSPPGAYGFQATTHLANIPNDSTWQKTWGACLQQAMRRTFEVEEKAHGKDSKSESLKKALHEKVIPRLLKPLETEGRSIQPYLIHSDIWPGNMMLDSDTYGVIIFDSCAHSSHDEADLGTWRTSGYKLGRPFIKKYQKVMGISEPQADWDDRNALYAIRYDLLVSAPYASDMKLRSMVMAEMQRLVDKYADGNEGFEEKSSAVGVASLMATLNLPQTKSAGKHQDEVEAVGLKAQEVN